MTVKLLYIPGISFTSLIQMSIQYIVLVETIVICMYAANLFIYIRGTYLAHSVLRTQLLVTGYSVAHSHCWE